VSAEDVGVVKAPTIRRSIHANDYDNRSRHRQIGLSGARQALTGLKDLLVLDAQQQRKNGKRAMVPTMQREQVPDVSGEQRITGELVKRIRNLRWMGMEIEAKRLQVTLCRLQQTDSVLAAPPDTD
jgi:hypothetical protein